ncbi:MAG: CHC2 zinc finger domain-containing protein, partial [Microgenomates group bacterium]
MDGAIAEIKSKLDIAEFLGTFITLKKAGRNYKANCPFHNEKTPSFVISPDRQIWHCFGACQDGGDVITFFMKWENITFYEALKELALKTNTKLVTTAIEDNAWKQKERLFTINALAAKYYNYLLENHAVAAGAREY